MSMPSLASLISRLVPADSLRRKLIAIRLAESMGKGVFISGSVIYFTLAVGLSAKQVGLGISAAGLSGFVSSIVFGVIADKVGAKKLLTILFGMLAVGFALYSIVDTVTWFFILVISVAFIEYGTGPTNSALVGAVVPPEERVKLKAMMRSVFNIGFSLGIGVAAVAALRPELLILIPLVTACLMVGAAILVTRLPSAPAKPAPVGFKRFSAIRDLRFVSVIAVSMVLASHVTLVLVTVPLWALNRTSVPHFVIPALLIFNTVFVILFQVRASKGADTVDGAAKLARRSGLWLAGGCAVISLTALFNNLTLVAILCVATIVILSVSEIMQAASGWGLAFGLAPDHAQGEYLGTFDLHVITQNIIGPAILSGFVLATGFWGWIGIAVLALIASALIVPVTRRSEHAMQRSRMADQPEPAVAGSS